MTSTGQTPIYPRHTVNRATRALICSPFQLALFQALRNQSVPLNKIAGVKGVEAGYTQKTISESRAEAQLLWLIKVGLLRREVDGQGLTDSFRLTPLGRQIITKYEPTPNSLPQPDSFARVFNWLNRWLKWSL
ncbi:Npun_F0494 family protein [Myxosarcina sp. GI1]|uniref:Npun_F0494 family protein n=1 Tax=Myxosarcina sp. GI1 TaxID=1541065 RepID=UPI00055F6F4F|nr:Npun_F0494 family protein [Myxosarcina sp. GI1]